MNETNERELDAVILTGGRRLRSAGIHLGHWKFDEYVDAAVRELDRVAAERDTAIAQMEQLRIACKDVPEELEAGAPYLFDGAKWEKMAARIRAALGSEKGTGNE